MLVRRHPGAAVVEDHHLVIAVMRIARAAVHHTVGRDAAEHQPFYGMGAQDGFERGAVERADAVFNYVEVALLRREQGVDFGAMCAELEDALTRAPEKIGEAGGHSR